MWLSQCSNEHEHGLCHGMETRELPTRLLSIRENGIKLVMPASLQETPRYATLSYCWGSRPFTKLTSENYDAFMDDVPLESLPETLRAAIDYTRRLGLEYIWIDALCIIQTFKGQDENPDWLYEAGRMSSVFGGSYINLAVSSSTSVYDRFPDQKKMYSCGFQVQVQTQDKASQLQDFYAPDTVEAMSYGTHLATRGWVFQEKLLAPRTVHFGDRGIFWECRSTIATQVHPHGLPDTDRWGELLVKGAPRSKERGWNAIVERYSKTNLTYGSDKLPALAGVAARMQDDAAGDQYLAGLWRNSLLSDGLLWKRAGGAPTKRPEWRAPTWSWASVDGEIKVVEGIFLDGTSMIRVIQAWTEPYGPDPYGAVKGGELTIGCAGLVHTFLPPGKDWNRNGSLASDLGSYATMNCLDDVVLEEDGSASVFILPVLWDGNQNLPTGIMLQICGDKKGHFRRVGSYFSEHLPILLRWPNDLLVVWETIGASTAEAHCSQVDHHYPETPYVITIV
ncbi:HET-domain-containing protein [Apiospora saccharicola]|uniref:HET-domain-containing protein n=1 Tax=Apiospora saccharicola TaxID=335842 RepID=A0ABR1UZC0_9PEZI